MLSPFFLTCVHLFLVYLCAVPPSQQKEKKVTVKAEEGNSIVLKCNPPQSSMEPVIHWMDEREFIISASISSSIKSTLALCAQLFVDHIRERQKKNITYCSFKLVNVDLIRNQIQYFPTYPLSVG